MPNNQTTQPKIYFENLAVEVTRRCNMTCKHCMRGDPQNVDLNPQAVDRLLSRTESIDVINLTGGEPTLNPAGIQTVADLIRKYSLPVDSVYLVTNGLTVPDEFLIAYASLYVATNAGECSGLALSTDMFHDPIPAENVKRLRMFSTFTEQDKKTNWLNVPPKAFGRALELDNVETTDKYLFSENPFSYCEMRDGNIYLYDMIVTLTVNGDLLTQCDYSYDITDQIKICNVFDPNWFDVLRQKVLDANPENQQKERT